LKKILHNVLKFLIPLAIGGGILWYLYKGQDIHQIIQVLHSGIDWWWIVLSLVFAVFSHILRAYRWKQQLKAVNQNPSLNDLTNSVFGNYGVNLIFPRLGELWRCNFVARRQKMPFSVVLGTVVSERIFDVLCIGFVMLFTILSQSHFFFSFFQEHPTIIGSLSRIFASPLTYLMLVIFAVVAFLIRKSLMRSSFMHTISQMLSKLWQGIQTIKTMKHKWFYIFLTFGIWLLYFLNFYVCLYAFDFSKNLGVINGLTLFVMGSLGVIVPVQGGTGPWHFMIIATMVLMGVAETQAATFALIVHAIQQGFVMLLGLYAMVYISVVDRLRKKEQLTV
jgi:conserved hypothetical protein